MQNMKYLMIGEHKTPILFCPTLTHSQVARHMCGADSVKSAGFVSFGVDEKGEVSVSAHGSSESLKIDSAPEEDSRILQRLVAPDW